MTDSPTPRSEPTALDALQQTLAAEHAVVHLFTALGGMTSASREPELAALLREQYQVHRGRREQLMVMVRTQGAQPVAAEPAYALPEASTADLVRAAGLEAEERCAQTYAAQVAATTAEARDWAVMTLAETASTLLRWGADATPFPGAPDLLA
ncbi:DUF4439 domain-containing protein [Nocardioides yefusunii]|uniref:DUF4439 domain-containing protein n=1 Tax=Nocardioides yefusunii TaxID=2500546 RepID=A0ABW1QX33_9ACTN|nr:DUF4439 domain-containing protein [Nocardioides yefusunii]